MKPIPGAPPGAPVPLFPRASPTQADPPAQQQPPPRQQPRRTVVLCGAGSTVMHLSWMRGKPDLAITVSDETATGKVRYLATMFISPPDAIKFLQSVRACHPAVVTADGYEGRTWRVFQLGYDVTQRYHQFSLFNRRGAGTTKAYRLFRRGWSEGVDDLAALLAEHG